ncbi:MAG: undecaprenyl-phosphate glucose phosphotransferase [Methylobacterium mesophilicum]|nr:undecaprenyl-phosphate glucose phosphotransferase [Methylobacterium mesophilicum]
MNDLDPSNRFSLDDILRRPEDETGGAGSARLNKLAREIASQYRQDSISPELMRGAMLLCELVLLAASGLVIYALYVGHPSPIWAYYLGAIGAASIGAVILLEGSGAYQIGALLRPSLVSRAVVFIWSGVFALVALAGFFLKVTEELSRFWLGSWYLTGLALLLLFRFVMSRVLRKWARDGRMERRAVIVGGGKPAEALIRSLEQQPYNDIRICGLFDDRDDTRSPPLVAGYPKLGTVDELIEFARIAQIDMMIVCLPLTAETRVLQLLKKLWVLPVDIRLSAHSNQLRFRPRAYSFIGSVPMLDIFDKPINDWDSVAKRVFDIVFSLLGLLVFSPVMIATAIAIKLDSKGPVFFRQKRHGFNNEVIDVWKFRSMYHEQADQKAAKAVTRGDPRVTRVGRFIRKTSIDELPQFFNSLGGSLSLVGPRPHAVRGHSRSRLFSEVVDGYFARHRVKPGVTGWAQINGWRGEIDHDDKIRMRTEFDLQYIENWSIWFDLKILFLTPVRLLNTENAY